MPATPEEREAWRTTNADLIEFMSLPANRSSSRFVRSMFESYTQWTSLTGPQTIALRGVMRELSTETAVTDQPATAEQAPTIPNGTFTITNHENAHWTFRIHTVRTGRLTGKRVVKRMGEFGDFKAFAFITPEAGIRVWRTYYEDQARNEPYIAAARALVASLHERSEALLAGAAEINTDEFEYNDIGRRYHVQAAVLCRICNRQLTNPESIGRGIGPECWSRVQGHQTVQARRAPVTEGTIGNVVQSSINADLSSVGGGMVGVNEQTNDYTQQIEAARRAATTTNVHGLLPCEYCGRDDFMQPQGRGRHISSCRTRYASQTLVARLATMGASAEVRPQRGAPASIRRPVRQIPRVNPSQLGTRFGGQVWAQ